MQIKKSFRIDFLSRGMQVKLLFDVLDKLFHARLTVGQAKTGKNKCKEIRKVISIND